MRLPLLLSPDRFLPPKEIIRRRELGSIRDGPNGQEHFAPALVQGRSAAQSAARSCRGSPTAGGGT